ncbi:Alcohol O-acetyltransferase [Madurella fahalii]|uniref:Alcohol O-acetyltransferase n=1 Tax=Madurella fahalii TaxID=1157608 RepID=A0ABQ0G9A2_9PEZI
MEAPSHFFSDCLDFDDANSFQSPDQDIDGGSIALNSFNPYGTKLDIGGPPTPADARDGEHRPDVWDSFADPIGGAMTPVGQKPLFVDPGLCSPESEDGDTKPQINVLTVNTSRASTRRASSSKSFSQRTSKSSSSSTDVTLPEQEPPKKRKSRKIKKESSTAEDEEKRIKFLERNRIAAMKCREKKKHYVSELEEAKIKEETQNVHLRMVYNGLLSEVSSLKHMLMTHAECNDENIDQWINNSARRIVQTPNEPFRQSFSFGQSTQPHLTTESPRSRNPSIASSYPSLQSVHSVQFDGFGPGERQGSIAYSHGTASLYTSPTDDTFPCLESHQMKREPGINYDHMPDSMFTPDQPRFGGG